MIDFDEVRHPDYIYMLDRWRMAYDFWRGGVHVLMPDYPVYRARSARNIEPTSYESEDTKSELVRNISNYEWTSVATNSYIWKHEKESTEAFRDRVRRVVHFPVFQSIANIFAAGILRTPPTRVGNIRSTPWREYHQDVDLSGTNIDAFIRQALCLGIVWGRVHAITDRPHYDIPAANRAEQIARNERAYSQLLSPIDLVDWELDEYGRFKWVRVREDDTPPRGYLDDIRPSQNQYRIWTLDHWELWKTPYQDDQSTSGSNNKQWYLASDGRHGFGEVPIATLECSKDGRAGTMRCESPISDILDGDRGLLNEVSELDEIARAQSFSILWIPEIDGPMGPIDIGPYNAITGPSEAGPPQYISPDSSLATGKWTRLQERFHELRQLAGVGRGRAEYSKEERSGSTLSLESEDKQNQMRWWASSVSEFDEQLHRHVAMWEEEKDFPVASYPKTFDLKTIGSQIYEFVQLNSTQVLGAEASAELAKPLVAKIMKEHGIDKDRIEAVLASIDKEKLEKEKVRDAMQERQEGQMGARGQEEVENDS